MNALVNPMDIQQGVMGAFQAGRQMRAQNETQNALATLVTNPGDQQSMTRLAQFNPQAAMQMQERQAQQQAAQRAARKQEIAGLAARGDKTALLELWGVDYETAGKLEEAQKEKALEGMEYVAQAAFQIDRLPAEQRAAAWDAYIELGVAAGFDGLAQYRGQYSEQKLYSVLSQAGQMKEFMQSREPKYMAVPYDATLVNTRDPAAVSQFGQGAPAQAAGGDIPTISDPAQAKTLPPGTQFRTPDGRLLRVPGGPASAPGGFPGGG